MTKSSILATLVGATLLIANASGSFAAIGPVPSLADMATLPAASTLHGFTVTSPALVGGPSATNYAEYYDGDGPQLPGLIRAYDDYARYYDVEGVATGSVIRDRSFVPNRDDPYLTAIYGEFDYMFSRSAPAPATAHVAVLRGSHGGQRID